MERRIWLACFVAVAVLVYLPSPGTANHVVNGGLDHACDAPIGPEQIHEAHGLNHCGNVLSGKGAQENCTIEITSLNGTLQHGEYLDCSDNVQFGSFSGSGCSWDIVQICGGRVQSGSILAPLGTNGDYPRCSYGIPGTGYVGDSVGYTCQWISQQSTQQTYCYCHENGIFSCENRHFDPLP